jgi:uncharacterized protein (TIGR02996 family)
MADVMAIVSKAVFEKAAGKSPAVGTRLAMDRYVSANKNLEPLGAGGKLYLVTVRPPDEKMWLVAVLDRPKFDGAQWTSTPCDTPITDISKLRSKLKFESGKGITAAAGALGMSLQTPRVLTAADAALLDAAIGDAPAAAGTGAPTAALAASAKPTLGGSRRATLLAAVIADPDSDAARQVYADELTAANDPRGELILVEMALSGPLSIRKREELARRRAELLAAHAKAWWPTKLEYRTHAGFVTAITGSLATLAAAAALIESEPIVEVAVTSIDDAAVKKLLAAPWLPRVRRLSIRGTMTDAGFATLCGGHLPQLRALNVTANQLGPAALGALADHLPACTTLVLTGNTVRDLGIAGLRAWKHLPALDTLYLSGCGLTEAGVETLIAGPLPALDKLCLSSNRLGDAVADAFVARAANLPSLRVLELKQTGITRRGVDVLMTAKLPALFRVDVRRNRLEAADVADLAPRVRGGVRA